MLCITKEKWFIRDSKGSPTWSCGCFKYLVRRELWTFRCFKWALEDLHSGVPVYRILLTMTLLLLCVSLPAGNSPVHPLCRFLQLQDTLSFRCCRCRTSTGNCRVAPAATDPATERIGSARRTSVTPTSGSVWRSTSWRCPRPGPAASAPPRHPCSVGIHFLYTRVTKPGSCCRSALRGRWVQKLGFQTRCWSWD